MDTRQHEIENQLAAVRQERALSASALAKIVGVSRQAIYSIEAGAYVPNTALGLRLARALAVKVDDLFSLPRQNTRPLTATVIPFTQIQPGQPVQLCRVDDRLVGAAMTPLGAYLPTSDGVVTSRGRPGKARLRLHRQESDFPNRVLIAGCDPAASILAHHLRPAGPELVMVHRNSSDSLALLKEGCVHMAGTHLRDAATGESNIAAIMRLFPRRSVAVIAFAIWQEGLITASGNPKHIRGVEDLARKGVKFLNRERGAGSRLLLDTHLKRLKLSANRIRGYGLLSSGHIAAAQQVKNGSADCCLATEAAARVFGLHFVPLESARYDLVLRKHHLESPAVQAVLDTIARAAFQRELTGAAGYDTTATGERIM